MDVDRALVDRDVAAPDAVEQLLAGEHPAGALHRELEQAALCRFSLAVLARGGFDATFLRKEANEAAHRRVVRPAYQRRRLPLLRDKPDDDEAMQMMR